MFNSHDDGEALLQDKVIKQVTPATDFLRLEKNSRAMKTDAEGNDRHDVTAPMNKPCAADLSAKEVMTSFPVS